MPVIPAAGALIGLTGAAGYVAGSVMIGAAIGGITSALAGGKIGKGMLLGGITGLITGGIGAAAGAAGNAANAVGSAAEGATVAGGNIGQAVPMANATRVVGETAGKGLLAQAAPSLSQWTTPGPTAGGGTTAGVVAGGASVVPPVDPTMAAAKSITQGQMISGAMQGAGNFFSSREEAEAEDRLLDKQIDARQVRYERNPGLLAPRLSSSWSAPRRASFNRQTGRWEYGVAQ